MDRSLNCHLQQCNGNDRVSDDRVAYASASERATALAIRGYRLRPFKPEERAGPRLEHPQTLWDLLCGRIMRDRGGGIVAARDSVGSHGPGDSAAQRGLLKVGANACDDDYWRRETLLID